MRRAVVWRGDCDGRKIDGFTFAPTGQLTIRDVERTNRAVTLPGEYENVTGLENLEQWTVTINGKPGNGRLIVRDGKLVALPKGVTIIVR